MTELVRRIRIFVASPGDVQAERDALATVIEKLHRTLGEESGLSIELVRWETHAYPAAGDPQAAINQQIDAYEIFVGIFWKRFGTPTRRAGSGTEEEYRRAYDSWVKSKKPPILLYFCKRPYFPENADEIEQMGRVMRFRESLEGQHLWWWYETAEEFAGLADEHLYKAINDLVGGEAGRLPEPPLPKIDVRQEVQENQGMMIGFVEHYHEALSGEPSTESSAEGSVARNRYLERLRVACRLLPLSAAGAKDADEEDVSLEDIYVSLNTTSMRDSDKARADNDAFGKEKTPIGAMEAVAETPRLVLLGNPGSGKSTFVNQLLALQADALLGEVSPPAGLSDSLVPVKVVLRDLAVALKHRYPQGIPEQETDDRLAPLIMEHACDFLKQLQSGAFEHSLRRAFDANDVLLVLDGLDEVPFAQRDDMRRLVHALMRRSPPKRVVITCRIRSYRNEANEVARCQAFTLAPFTDEQKQKFAKAWYDQTVKKRGLDRELADRKAADLARAATSEELTELAENPLLLTTMALIHQRDIGLPDKRAELYDVAIEVLLWKWQKKKGEGDLDGAVVSISPELITLLKDEHRVYRTLMRFAYESHRQQEGNDEEQAGMTRGASLDLLGRKEYLGTAALAEEFLDYVDQRSGLLHGYGGDDSDDHPVAYGFPHRTFQEYLAGRYMAQQSIVDVLTDHAREGQDWYEAVQLGLEDLVYNRDGEQRLMRSAFILLPRSFPREQYKQRLVLWTGFIAALVGADLIEADTATDKGGIAFLKRLKKHLVRLLGSALSPIERAEAGRLLGKLGDPRNELLDLDAARFCLVPAGPFLMGSDDEDEMAWNDEKPIREQDIPYAYWIGQYPVTNAHYAAFVHDGCYDDSAWWTVDGWNERKKRGWEGPAFYRDVFRLPNHPVVGVSWYEAMAFCRWLDERWKASGMLPPDFCVALASEMEWEKAARGGLNKPCHVRLAPLNAIDFKRTDLEEADNTNPARRFPWGNNSDHNAMNFFESRIGRTSTLGCFPDGESLYGAHDMAGNVLEWTREYWSNRYPEDPSEVHALGEPEGTGPRVIRGGAFGNDVRYCRCASRSGNHPDSRHVRLGFRLVLLPPSALIL